MREVIVTYTCDSCGKGITKKKEDDYPFREGWHRLNSFSVDVPKVSVHSVVKQPGKVDVGAGDFCCKDCFFGKLIEALKLAKEVSLDDVPRPIGRGNGLSKEPDFDSLNSMQSLNLNRENSNPFGAVESPSVVIDEVSEPRKNVPKKRGFFGKKG